MATITSNDKESYAVMTLRYTSTDASRKVLDMIPMYSTVLSAGCGTGREVQYLVHQRKCKVVAIDIDKKAIQESKQLNPEVEHICADMVCHFFGERKFDHIVCLFNTINYLERKDRQIFIINCQLSLAPAGMVHIVTTHIFSNKRLLLSNIKHRMHFHPFPWEFKEWFKGTSFKVTKTKIGGHIYLRGELR